jgi:hypothetical protein
LTDGGVDHYLTSMARGSFSNIFVGRRFLAIVMALTVLFAGIDIHPAGASSFHGSSDAGVILTMDQKTSPDSGKGSVADHHCHGCVVFAAIDSDAGFPGLVPSTPSISETADLIGALSEFPARPPRTEIQLS